MDRALLYLIWRQRTNAARQFVRGLKRPRKVLGMAFWILILCLMLWSQLMVRSVGAGGEDGATALMVLLGFILVASTFGGLMQRGLAFQPADIDFLFSGPFTRRQLVFYRLVQLYPMAAISTAFLLVFLGPRLDHVGWGAVGIFSCQLVALHLQTLTAILAAAISDRVFGKLRGRLQIVLLLVVAGGMFAGIVSFVETGGLGADIRGAFRSETARMLLFPAAEAARLSTATSFAEASGPLTNLILAVLVSLGAVALLQVNFFEASLETSRRFRKAVSRSRRGVSVVPREGDRVRRIRLPSLPLFRGAGALFWKNLVTVGRSLRVVFFSLVMTAVFAAVALGAMSRVGEGGSGQLVSVLVMGAFLPLMLQQHLSFDFRRDIESLAELRLLPASPTAIAAAEVGAPIFLTVLMQWALLATAAALVPIPQEAIVAALVGYPVLTAATCIVGNIGFLFYPVRTVTATGRPNTGGATLSSLLNLVVFVVAVLPASAAAVATWFLLESAPATFATFVGSQLVVDVGLLLLLGYLFKTHELTDLE